MYALMHVHVRCRYHTRTRATLHRTHTHVCAILRFISVRSRSVAEATRRAANRYLKLHTT